MESLSKKIRIKQDNRFVLVEENLLNDTLCPVEMERPMLSFRVFAGSLEVIRLNVGIDCIMESDYTLDGLKELPRVKCIKEFLSKHDFVRCYVYDYAQLITGQATFFYVNTFNKGNTDKIIEELLTNLIK